MRPNFTQMQNSQDFLTEIFYQERTRNLDAALEVPGVKETVDGIKQHFNDEEFVLLDIDDSGQILDHNNDQHLVHLTAFHPCILVYVSEYNTSKIVEKIFVCGDNRKITRIKC